VLYFGLIELLLVDSSRELRSARQFRSRVIAQTLAENGAEAAAWKMLNPVVPPIPVEEETEQGTMTGRRTMLANAFTLTGEGASAGLEPVRSRVLLKGYIDGKGEIHVDISVHSQ
jgi:hypothetical protein